MSYLIDPTNNEPYFSSFVMDETVSVEDLDDCTFRIGDTVRNSSYFSNLEKVSCVPR